VRDRHKRTVGLLRVRCPPTAFLAAHPSRTETSARPVSKSSSRKTTRSDAHPKGVILAQAGRGRLGQNRCPNVRVGSISPFYLCANHSGQTRMQNCFSVRRHVRNVAQAEHSGQMNCLRYTSTTQALLPIELHAIVGFSEPTVHSRTWRRSRPKSGSAALAQRLGVGVAKPASKPR
jgi:hypothetical protein